MEVKDIELQACPHCGGDGVIEDEGGWCVYVTCCDCGAHTAQVDYHSPEERLDAAKRAAFVWNIGKVVSSQSGPSEFSGGQLFVWVSPAQSRA